MIPNQINDPLPAYKFLVEINGIIEAGFLNCKGLGVERKVFKYIEGGVNNFIHLLPNQIQYAKVTLQHGSTYSNELWAWLMEGQHNGKLSFRPLSILLYDTAGKLTTRWDLINAFPIKWLAPKLDTGSKNPAIEKLDIVHHGMEMKVFH